MAAAANSFQLGKYARLYVANDKGVAAQADASFKRVVNENDIDFSYKNAKENVNTKEKGQLTLPSGDESYQLKVTVDQALEDSGFPLLFNALNDSIQMQVRDTVTSKVLMEGAFTVSDMGFKGSEKNVRQFTFTLDNSDTITMHFGDGGRAVSGGAS